MALLDNASKLSTELGRVNAQQQSKTVYNPVTSVYQNRSRQSTMPKKPATESRFNSRVHSLMNRNPSVGDNLLQLREVARAGAEDYSRKRAMNLSMQNDELPQKLTNNPQEYSMCQVTKAFTKLAQDGRDPASRAKSREKYPASPKR